MGSGRDGHPKRSWFFYISDEGMAEAYARLMALPYLGPALKLSLRLGVALAALWLLHALRQPFAPSDWVEVAIRNVPKGLRQIHLIADGPDGASPLKTYHAKLLVFASDPRRFGEGWNESRREDERHAALQWPVARRYGALAQRTDGTWEIWWLGPAEMEGPSLSRYVVGGGKAEIRLPDESRATAPSEALLKQVGLPNVQVIQ